MDSNHCSTPSKKRSLDECHTPNAKIAKISKVQSSPVNRKFNESWKSNREWLRYDAKLGLMFCDICIKAQVTNSFTTGCNVLKKDSVTKHEGRNKDHIKAVSAQSLRMSMETAREKALDRSQAAVTSAMKNVYFCAEEELANSVVPKLNKHMLLQGVTSLADLRVDGHTTYEHSTSINDMQHAIASVLEDDMVQKVKASGKFSLMFDESTDISIKQNIIMYVRVLESDSLGYVVPNTYFFGIDSLARANADSIFAKVKHMLETKGIDLSNLCGLSTDGAAVMVGHKSGVVTRLKREVEGVLATHCVAHRLALSACDGADAIPYLCKVQEILNSTYKYFHNSPKNMAMLVSIQSLFPGQSSKFKEVFHTRWLSFEGSVSAMVGNYSSLVSVFLEEKSGKALSMHKSITCYKFLYVVHFLADVLKPLCTLSKMYQKQDLDYTQVTPLLQATIDRVNELGSERNGQNLSEFLRQVPEEPSVQSDGLVTFEYGGHTIRDSDKQRAEAVSACDKFVTGMVKSLNVRFSDNEDSSILTALSNLFNPSVSVAEKCTDKDTVIEYLATVGVEGSRDDLSNFLQFAHAMVDNGNLSVKNTKDLANLAIKNKDVYPAAAEAAERLLVAPVSTAECERGFSRQNLIKTCLRNSLAMSCLDDLMRISIHGPPVQEFDFGAAFAKWRSVKARRILA